MAITPDGIDPSKLKRPDLGFRIPVPGNAGALTMRWVTAAAMLLALMMLAGVVAIWKTGAWSPVPANGATAARGTAKGYAAALDSARVYSKRVEWKKAESVLRELTKQYPMEQEVRVALAESLVAQKRPKDAFEQYEKALAIGPRDAQLEFAAGVAASSGGLPERALEHFSMAQAGDPLVSAYPLHLAMVQRKLGQTDASKASLLRAANLDPDNAFAWGTLADIALAENNVGLALQHAAKARTLQPESKEWRLIEARALKRKGEPEKALMVLLPMDVSQRREPMVARQMAECYGLLGKTLEAAGVLAEAANAAGTDAKLAYDAAVAFERAGEKTHALEWAKRAAMLGHADAEKLLARLRG
jgi:predicted Zn-dependent protease